MSGGDIHQSAQRICYQCKSSKKKCDKLLPVCSRCARLSMDCLYGEPSTLGEQQSLQEAADSRFDKVFERLKSLEYAIKDLKGVAAGPTFPANKDEAPTRSDRKDLRSRADRELDIDLLRPEPMVSVLSRSVSRVLEESGTTAAAICDVYFTTYHEWIPIVSQSRFIGVLQEGVGASTATHGVLILAMHLLITPIAEHPESASLSLSPWYLACKGHFAQEANLNEPYLELVQAGILIALFEHLQCIQSRAYTTFGLTTRLAYALELDVQAAESSNLDSGVFTPEKEEILITWWVLRFLDKYLIMTPSDLPKQANIVSQESVNGPPISSFITITQPKIGLLSFELASANLLGRVQSLMRNNRGHSLRTVSEEAQSISQDITHHLNLLKQRKPRPSAVGNAVTLSAALSLQCFYAKRSAAIDAPTASAIHSFLMAMRSIFDRPEASDAIANGRLFYAPLVWIFISYQAIVTYSFIHSVGDSHQLPDIDMSVFYNILHASKTWYKFSEYCLTLIEDQL